MPIPKNPRALRIGAVGLGRAFSLMAEAFREHPWSVLVGGVDPRSDARQRFEQEFSAPAFETIEQLCSAQRIDVAYIATPHHLHVEQACAAAGLGKHLLVEKPLALSLEECRTIIDAAQRAGVHLVVGHTHSFDAPVARARALIAQRAYGRLRMITSLNFTDFLYRPRRPEELATRLGGGVIFNQAPHQVDVLRVLGGGRLASVRAAVGRWDGARPTEGAYSAFFQFENGAAAALTYSGYAHFDSDELCDWIGESGLPKNSTNYGAARRALDAAEQSGGEVELKAASTYGSPAYNAIQLSRKLHQHFGFVVASCEGADLRLTPSGVMVYADRERRIETCAPPEIPRREVVDELKAAVVDGTPPAHDGPWALATIEACLAILSSAEEGREAKLFHQCEYRDPIG